jgi:hypothetical protein
MLSPLDYQLHLRNRIDFLVEFLDEVIQRVNAVLNRLRNGVLVLLLVGKNLFRLCLAIT